MAAASGATEGAGGVVARSLRSEAESSGVPAPPSSLAFPDILPFPLLSRHRLSADLLALLYLHAVDEHAEVLADRPAPRACREASRAALRSPSARLRQPRRPPRR